MYLFRTTSSKTFIMSDVQSVYIPSSNQDWYREVKFWTTDRQHSNCLWIPWTKPWGSWHDRLGSTASCTTHAESVEETSEYGVLGRHQTCPKEFKFHQTWSNAIILYETPPAHCIPKVVRMETGGVMYEKVYASPRPPPKISLNHDWMKDLGSETVKTPNKPNQKPKIQL